jgi:hypothetical protein
MTKGIVFINNAKSFLIHARRRTALKWRHETRMAGQLRRRMPHKRRNYLWK